MIIQTKMNDIIVTKPTFNIKELVNANLTINLQNKLVEKLQKHFNEDELTMYIMNLYGYLNFHPTDDYPINLEDILDFVGFANKGNAKRMLENNFIKDEDYKVDDQLLHREKQLLERESSLLRREKRSWGATGGENKEKITLNIDTFKQLCMLVKTEKSKKIRRYYVKLENVYNELIVEENKENQKLIQENKQKLKQKEKEIENKQEEIERQSDLLKYKDKEIAYLDKKELSYIYIGHNPKVSNITKIGISKMPIDRLNAHRTSNSDYMYLETYECEKSKEVETIVKTLLNGHNLKQGENNSDTQLCCVIDDVSTSSWFHIGTTEMSLLVKYFVDMFNKQYVMTKHLVQHFVGAISTESRQRIPVLIYLDESYYKEYSEYQLKKGRYVKVHDLVSHLGKLTKKDGRYKDKQITNPTGMYRQSFIDEVKENICTINNVKVAKINGKNCFDGIEIVGFNQELEDSIYQEFLETHIMSEPGYRLAQRDIILALDTWLKEKKIITSRRVYEKGFENKIGRELKKNIKERFNIDKEEKIQLGRTDSGSSENSPGAVNGVAGYYNLKLINSIPISESREIYFSKKFYQEFIDKYIIFDKEYRSTNYHLAEKIYSLTNDKRINSSSSRMGLNPKDLKESDKRYNNIFLNELKEYISLLTNCECKILTDYVAGKKYSGYMGFCGLKLKDKDENYIPEETYKKFISNKMKVVDTHNLSINEILNEFEKILTVNIRTDKGLFMKIVKDEMRKYIKEVYNLESKYIRHNDRLTHVYCLSFCLSDNNAVCLDQT